MVETEAAELIEMRAGILGDRQILAGSDPDARKPSQIGTPQKGETADDHAGTRQPGVVQPAHSKPIRRRLGTMRSMARQLIRSGSPFEATIGFSRAVRIGDVVAVAGTAPVWPDGSVDPDPYVQARRCLEIIEKALIEAGAALTDVVRTRMFITEMGVSAAVGRAHGEVFGEIRPASTMVVVTGLVDERWKVEIEADAVVV
jgi:enamine deaminase RidA (YjgF/YER057c/UK114 family)